MGRSPLREAIEGGKVGWSLDQLKSLAGTGRAAVSWNAGCSRTQILQRSIGRVMAGCEDPRLRSRAFYAQANLLTGGLLSIFSLFYERIKEFYGLSGQA